ncbi:MAG: SRPBCC domain-containing protein, partial [Pseudomonadota bacterium]
VAILLIAVVGLFLAGKDTRVVSTEIEIASSPEKIWGVLLNIDEWKSWSPIIKDSKGEVALNSKLVITMSGHDGKEGKAGQTYEPVVTVLEANKNMTWTANMGSDFLMKNGKVLELVPTENGTKLIHKETFSGLMVPLMWGMVQENVPRMLDSMNEALKKLVEES